MYLLGAILNVNFHGMTRIERRILFIITTTMFGLFGHAFQLFDYFWFAWDLQSIKNKFCLFAPIFQSRTTSSSLETIQTPIDHRFSGPTVRPRPHCRVYAYRRHYHNQCSNAFQFFIRLLRNEC